MPTLYIIDKDVQNENPWMFNVLPIKASDYILLTKYSAPADTLYSLAPQANSYNLKLEKPRYIHKQDELAQDYLRAAKTKIHPNYPAITYQILQDKDLDSMMGQYAEPYPRPPRLYVTHTLPLNTSMFQQDDLLLTVGVAAQEAKLIEINYSKAYDTCQYGKTTYIPKTPYEDGAVIHNVKLHEKIEALLKHGTWLNPSFLENTDSNYHLLLDALLNPAPQQAIGPVIQKLSQSCMGIGLKSDNPDSPTDVSHSFSPELDLDTSHRGTSHLK